MMDKQHRNDLVNRFKELYFFCKKYEGGTATLAAQALVLVQRALSDAIPIGEVAHRLSTDDMETLLKKYPTSPPRDVVEALTLLLGVSREEIIIATAQQLRAAENIRVLKETSDGCVLPYTMHSVYLAGPFDGSSEVEWGLPNMLEGGSFQFYLGAKKLKGSDPNSFSLSSKPANSYVGIYRCTDARTGDSEVSRGAKTRTTPVPDAPDDKTDTVGQALHPSLAFHRTSPSSSRAGKQSSSTVSASRPPPPHSKKINNKTKAHSSTVPPHSIFDDREELFDNSTSVSKANITGAGTARRGLENIGNTCYMNSVLQALKATRLSHLLLSENYLNRVFPDSSVTAELQKLLEVMHQESSSTINPKSFLKALGDADREFSSGCQQDAYHFLSVLLQTLNNEWEKSREPSGAPGHQDHTSSSEEDSEFAIQDCIDLFLFDECSTIRCRHCAASSRTYHECRIALVPVPSKASIGVEDCLKRFCEETVDSYQCEECKKVAAAPRHVTFDSCPEILVIMLRRFHINDSGDALKISSKVDVPEELDLSPFMSGTPPTRTPYRLVSSVHHTGDLEWGHYTACVLQNEGNDEWVMYNDTDAYDVGKPDFAQAYILFYEKVPLDVIGEAVQPPCSHTENVQEAPRHFDPTPESALSVESTIPSEGIRIVLEKARAFNNAHSALDRTKWSSILCALAMSALGEDLAESPTIKLSGLKTLFSPSHLSAVARDIGVPITAKATPEEILRRLLQRGRPEGARLLSWCGDGFAEEGGEGDASVIYLVCTRSEGRGGADPQPALPKYWTSEKRVAPTDGSSAEDCRIVTATYSYILGVALMAGSQDRCRRNNYNINNSNNQGEGWWELTEDCESASLGLYQGCVSSLEERSCSSTTPDIHSVHCSTGQSTSCNEEEEDMSGDESLGTSSSTSSSPLPDFLVGGPDESLEQRRRLQSFRDVWSRRCWDNQRDSIRIIVSPEMITEALELVRQPDKEWVRRGRGYLVQHLPVCVKWLQRIIGTLRFASYPYSSGNKATDAWCLFWRDAIIRPLVSVVCVDVAQVKEERKYNIYWHLILTVALSLTPEEYIISDLESAWQCEVRRRSLPGEGEEGAEDGGDNGETVSGINRIITFYMQRSVGAGKAIRRVENRLSLDDAKLCHSLNALREDSEGREQGFAMWEHPMALPIPITAFGNEIALRLFTLNNAVSGYFLGRDLYDVIPALGGEEISREESVAFTPTPMSYMEALDQTKCQIRYSSLKKEEVSLTTDTTMTQEDDLPGTASLPVRNALLATVDLCDRLLSHIATAEASSEPPIDVGSGVSSEPPSHVSAIDDAGNQARVIWVVNLLFHISRTPLDDTDARVEEFTATITQMMNEVNESLEHEIASLDVQERSVSAGEPEDVEAEVCRLEKLQEYIEENVMSSVRAHAATFKSATSSQYIALMVQAVRAYWEEHTPPCGESGRRERHCSQHDANQSKGNDIGRRNLTSRDSRHTKCSRCLLLTLLPTRTELEVKEVEEENYEFLTQVYNQVFTRVISGLAKNMIDLEKHKDFVLKRHREVASTPELERELEAYLANLHLFPIVEERLRAFIQELVGMRESLETIKVRRITTVPQKTLLVTGLHARLSSFFPDLSAQVDGEGIRYLFLCFRGVLTLDMDMKLPGVSVCIAAALVEVVASAVNLERCRVAGDDEKRCVVIDTSGQDSLNTGKNGCDSYVLAVGARERDGRDGEDGEAGGSGQDAGEISIKGRIKYVDNSVLRLRACGGDGANGGNAGNGGAGKSARDEDDSEVRIGTDSDFLLTNPDHYEVAPGKFSCQEEFPGRGGSGGLRGRGGLAGAKGRINMCDMMAACNAGNVIVEALDGKEGEMGGAGRGGEPGKGGCDGRAAVGVWHMERNRAWVYGSGIWKYPPFMFYMKRLLSTKELEQEYCSTHDSSFPCESLAVCKEVDKRVEFVHRGRKYKRKELKGISKNETMESQVVEESRMSIEAVVQRDPLELQRVLSDILGDVSAMGRIEDSMNTKSVTLQREDMEAVFDQLASFSQLMREGCDVLELLRTEMSASARTVEALRREMEKTSDSLKRVAHTMIEFTTHDNLRGMTSGEVEEAEGECESRSLLCVCQSIGGDTKKLAAPLIPFSYFVRGAASKIQAYNAIVARLRRETRDRGETYGGKKLSPLECLSAASEALQAVRACRSPAFFVNTFAQQLHASLEHAWCIALLRLSPKILSLDFSRLRYTGNTAFTPLLYRVLCFHHCHSSLQGNEEVARLGETPEGRRTLGERRFYAESVLTCTIDDIPMMISRCEAEWLSPFFSMQSVTPTPLNGRVTELSLRLHGKGVDEVARAYKDIHDLCDAYLREWNMLHRQMKGVCSESTAYLASEWMHSVFLWLCRCVKALPEGPAMHSCRRRCENYLRSILICVANVLREDAGTNALRSSSPENIFASRQYQFDILMEWREEICVLFSSSSEKTEGSRGATSASSNSVLSLFPFLFPTAHYPDVAAIQLPLNVWYDILTRAVVCHFRNPVLAAELIEQRKMLFLLQYVSTRVDPKLHFREETRNQLRERLAEYQTALFNANYERKCRERIIEGGRSRGTANEGIIEDEPVGNALHAILRLKCMLLAVYCELRELEEVWGALPNTLQAHLYPACSQNTLRGGTRRGGVGGMREDATEHQKREVVYYDCCACAVRNEKNKRKEIMEQQANENSVLVFVPEVPCKRCHQWCGSQTGGTEGMSDAMVHRLREGILIGNRLAHLGMLVAYLPLLYRTICFYPTCVHSDDDVKWMIDLLEKMYRVPDTTPSRGVLTDLDELIGNRAAKQLLTNIEIYLERASLLLRAGATLEHPPAREAVEDEMREDESGLVWRRPPPHSSVFLQRIRAEGGVEKESLYREMIAKIKMNEAEMQQIVYANDPESAAMPSVPSIEEEISRWIQCGPNASALFFAEKIHRWDYRRRLWKVVLAMHTSEDTKVCGLLQGVARFCDTAVLHVVRIVVEKMEELQRENDLALYESARAPFYPELLAALLEALCGVSWDLDYPLMHVLESSPIGNWMPKVTQLSYQAQLFLFSCRNHVAKTADKPKSHPSDANNNNVILRLFEPIGWNFSLDVGEENIGQFLRGVRSFVPKDFDSFRLPTLISTPNCLLSAAQKLLLLLDVKPSEWTTEVTRCRERRRQRRAKVRRAYGTASWKKLRESDDLQRGWDSIRKFLNDGDAKNVFNAQIMGTCEKIYDDVKKKIDSFRNDLHEFDWKFDQFAREYRRNTYRNEQDGSRRPPAEVREREKDLWHDKEKLAEVLSTIFLAFYAFSGKRYMPYRAQVFAVVALVQDGRSCMANINTGEGKTYITGCFTAFKLYMGYTPLVLSSNPPLARESKEAHEPVLEALFHREEENQSISASSIKRKIAALLSGRSASMEETDDNDLEVGRWNDFMQPENRNALYERCVLYGTLMDVAGDILHSYLEPGTYSRVVQFTRHANWVVADEADLPMIGSFSDAVFLGDPRPEFIKEIVGYPKLLRNINKGNSLAEQTLPDYRKSVFPMRSNDRDSVLSKEHFDKLHQSACTALETRNNNQFVCTGTSTSPYNTATGTVMRGTMWKDGLSAFINLKEGKEWVAETESTLAMTSLVFFSKLFVGRITGVTGTVGNYVTQRIYQREYQMKTVIIPTAFESQMMDLFPGVAPCREEWEEEVKATVKNFLSEGQSGLLIRNTVEEAQEMQKALQPHLPPNVACECYALDEDSRPQLSEDGTQAVFSTTQRGGRGLDVEANHCEGTCTLLLSPQNERNTHQGERRSARQFANGTCRRIFQDPQMDRHVAIKNHMKCLTFSSSKDLDGYYVGDDAQRHMNQLEVLSCFYRVQNKATMEERIRLMHLVSHDAPETRFFDELQEEVQQVRERLCKKLSSEVLITCFHKLAVYRYVSWLSKEDRRIRRDAPKSRRVQLEIKEELLKVLQQVVQPSDDASTLTTAALLSRTAKAEERIFMALSLGYSIAKVADLFPLPASLPTSADGVKVDMSKLPDALQCGLGTTYLYQSLRIVYKKTWRGEGGCDQLRWCMNAFISRLRAMKSSLERAEKNLMELYRERNETTLIQGCEALALFREQILIIQYLLTYYCSLVGSNYIVYYTSVASSFCPSNRGESEESAEDRRNRYLPPLKCIAILQMLVKKKVVCNGDLHPAYAMEGEESYCKKVWMALALSEEEYQRCPEDQFVQKLKRQISEYNSTTLGLYSVLAQDDVLSDIEDIDTVFSRVCDSSLVSFLVLASPYTHYHDEDFDYHLAWLATEGLTSGWHKNLIQVLISSSGVLRRDQLESLSVEDVRNVIPAFRPSENKQHHATDIDRFSTIGFRYTLSVQPWLHCERVRKEQEEEERERNSWKGWAKAYGPALLEMAVSIGFDVCMTSIFPAYPVYSWLAKPLLNAGIQVFKCWLKKETVDWTSIGTTLLTDLAINACFSGVKCLSNKVSTSKSDLAKKMRELGTKLRNTKVGNLGSKFMSIGSACMKKEAEITSSFVNWTGSSVASLLGNCVTKGLSKGASAVGNIVFRHLSDNVRDALKKEAQAYILSAVENWAISKLQKWQSSGVVKAMNDLNHLVKKRAVEILRAVKKKCQQNTKVNYGEMKRKIIGRLRGSDLWQRLTNTCFTVLTSTARRSFDAHLFKQSFKGEDGKTHKKDISGFQPLTSFLINAALDIKKTISGIGLIFCGDDARSCVVRNQINQTFDDLASWCYQQGFTETTKTGVAGGGADWTATAVAPDEEEFIGEVTNEVTRRCESHISSFFSNVVMRASSTLQEIAAQANYIYEESEKQKAEKRKKAENTRRLEAARKESSNLEEVLPPFVDMSAIQGSIFSMGRNTNYLNFDLPSSSNDFLNLLVNKGNDHLSSILFPSSKAPSYFSMNKYTSDLNSILFPSGNTFLNFPMNKNAGDLSSIFLSSGNTYLNFTMNKKTDDFFSILFPSSNPFNRFEKLRFEILSLPLLPENNSENDAGNTKKEGGTEGDTSRGKKGGNARSGTAGAKSSHHNSLDMFQLVGDWNLGDEAQDYFEDPDYFKKKQKKSVTCILSGAGVSKDNAEYYGTIAVDAANALYTFYDNYGQYLVLAVKVYAAASTGGASVVVMATAKKVGTYYVKQKVKETIHTEIHKQVEQAAESFTAFAKETGFDINDPNSKVPLKKMLRDHLTRRKYSPEVVEQNMKLFDVVTKEIGKRAIDSVTTAMTDGAMNVVEHQSHKVAKSAKRLAQKAAICVALNMPRDSQPDVSFPTAQYPPEQHRANNSSGKSNGDKKRGKSKTTEHQTSGRARFKDVTDHPRYKAEEERVKNSNYSDAVKAGYLNETAVGVAFNRNAMEDSGGEPQNLKAYSFPAKTSNHKDSDHAIVAGKQLRVVIKRSGGALDGVTYQTDPTSKRSTFYNAAGEKIYEMDSDKAKNCNIKAGKQKTLTDKKVSQLREANVVVVKDGPGKVPPRVDTEMMMNGIRSGNYYDDIMQSLKGSKKDETKTKKTP